MDELAVTISAPAKLISSLAKAKLNFGRLITNERADVKSDKANYSYKYADLAAVLDAIDKPLSSNGLVFVQFPKVDYLQSGAKVTVEATLFHESGESIAAAPLVMTSTRSDPQGVGSAITYGRRYQAVAFFGLAQEDDDGAVAKGKSSPQPTERKTQQSFESPPEPPQPQRPVASHRIPAAAVLNTLEADLPRKAEPPQSDTDAEKSARLHKRFHATGNETFGKLWAEKGKEIIHAVTAGESKSSAALTDEEKLALIKSFGDHKTEWENWADGSSADMPVVPVREVVEANPFH